MTCYSGLAAARAVEGAAGAAGAGAAGAAGAGAAYPRQLSSRLPLQPSASRYSRTNGACAWLHIST